VPTVEQRGAFHTGATGIFQDPFTGQPTATIPTNRNGAAIFSLYPFPNNPGGVYGANTFTHILPASARGTVVSGKIDDFFKIGGREQSITGRYNFTNDWREIPVTGDALFSTLKPRIRTQNFSFFLNSKLSGPNGASPIFNQVRLSYGRTRLRFDEVRDSQFLVPSAGFPNIPFLLNAPEILNVTLPPAPGTPNTGPVIYVRQPLTAENEIGPLGQVIVAGFSPVGVDVYNFPQRRVNNTYQFADQLTLRAGNHSLTFGSDNRRTELNSELPRNSRPLVTFSSAPRLIFVNGIPRFSTSADPNPIFRPEELVATDAPNSYFQTLSTGGPDTIGLRFYQINLYGQDEWRLRKDLSLSFGLRYEYNTPPREMHNLIEDTFSSPSLSLAPGLSTFIQGRATINDPDRNNLAPRIGVAYSRGHDRLTVIRGGYGIFYDQILGAVVSQSRNVFPSFFTLNFGGGPFTASGNQFVLVSFNPLTGFVNNFPIVSPGTLNRLNPQLTLSTFLPDLQTAYPVAISPTLPTRKLEMPTARHYTVTIEQQILSNLVVSAGYVGTRGGHLLRFTTPNLGPVWTVLPTALEVLVRPPLVVPRLLGRVSSPVGPVSGLGPIQIFETTANSRYDSLQVEVRGRFARSLQYRAAYTLSRATDDVSDVFDLAGAFALPQNSLTFAGERGPANFDARHRFAYFLIYRLPSTLKRSKFLSTLLSGTEIAASGRFQTGQPFTVNSTIDVNQDGNLTDRLNTNNGLIVTGNGRQPIILTTNNTLSLLAPFGQDGSIGRNTFRAGSILELDLGAIKNITFDAGKTLTLRVEFFNFPNRTNFGIPVRLLEAPSFGQATSAVTPGRRVQFSLKYSF
jgi:hypothetical protein